MNVTRVAPIAATPAEHATRRHLRGSSLLLIGRLISLLVNFGVQVLTVWSSTGG